MIQPLKPIREQLLHSLPAVFPGIDRVVMLYTSSEDELNGQELLRNGTNYRLRALIIDGLDCDKYINQENSGYAWLHPYELPFDRKRELNTNYHLFSEEQYLVLCVKLETNDEDLDSFYLFFREDQSNFGISRLQGSLDTARKALIGSLVLRMMRIFYRSADKYEAYLHKFTDVTRSLLEENSISKSNPSSLKWTTDWAHDFLKSFSHQPSSSWMLTEEALEKLNSATDYSSAKSALTNAAQIASMLYATDDVWTILPSFITFSAEDKKDKEIKEAPITGESRMSKAIAWLDNVEQATNKIMALGEEPTGNAVGQSLDRPVSAPAITDWLRQNQRRVMMLLDKHPAKWTLIRENFRPLINMIERELKVRQTG